MHFIFVLVVLLFPVNEASAENYILDMNIIEDENDDTIETILRDQDEVTAYLLGPRRIVEIYGSKSDTCNPKEKLVRIKDLHLKNGTNNIFLATGTLEVLKETFKPVKLCIGNESEKATNWIRIHKTNFIMFMWLAVVIITVGSSAVFTGLNIGITSLTLAELNASKNYGVGEKAIQAAKIIPFRQDYYLLATSFIIANAIVNILSAYASERFFEEIPMNPTLQIILTVFCPAILTLLIGEIFPQAICTKYPLPIASRTMHLTHTLMFIVYPIAKPVSMVFKFFSGKPDDLEMYDNKILAAVLEEHIREGRQNDEEAWTMQLAINMLNGVDMTVGKVLINNWETVRKLSAHEVLNEKLFKKISELKYSRFPIVEEEEILAVLHVKDLLAVKDPKYRGLTLGTIASLWHKSNLFRTVPYDTPIIPLIEEMRKGLPVVLVFKSNNSGRSNIVGMLTLEDLLEQLVGDIRDEREIRIKAN